MGSDRHRHPSILRWRPDLDRLERRLVEELGRKGAARPEDVASDAVARGLRAEDDA